MLRKLKTIEAEVPGLAKAGDQDTLPMLRNNGGVHNARMDLISEFLSQGLANDLERAATIVAQEVLDVFQQKAFGPSRR